MSVLDRPVLFPNVAGAGSLRRALALTATLALVTVAILLPVMQSSDEAAQGYRIRALEQQQADLEAGIHSASADVARLGSLARVDQEARNRLGMVPLDRTVEVSVAIPVPKLRTLPNGYLPPSTATAPARDPFWKRLLHALPFS